MLLNGIKANIFVLHFCLALFTVYIKFHMENLVLKPNEYIFQTLHISGGDNKEAYLIFGEYNSEPRWWHSSGRPIHRHSTQVERYDPPPFPEKARRGKDQENYFEF